MNQWFIKLLLTSFILLPSFFNPTSIYTIFADYDENVKADVANAFATAAMRYGHSQIQKVIKYAVDNTYSRGHDIIFSRVKLLTSDLS